VLPQSCGLMGATARKRSQHLVDKMVDKMSNDDSRGWIGSSRGEVRAFSHPA
jgi:hypothetical protein